MNEIKVNKPIILIKGKKYLIKFGDGDYEEAKFLEFRPTGSARFETQYGPYNIKKQDINNRVKETESINEIKRLQQLAGINEIKISNPIISKEDIVELYDKIDYFIGRFWRDDEEPAQDGYISGLDEELDKIMAENDFRYEIGLNDIRAYLSKDQNKNNILYHKLKELDSKINYNYTPQ